MARNQTRKPRVAVSKRVKGRKQTYMKKFVSAATKRMKRK